MTLVLKTHQEIDCQSQSQAEAAGITKKLIAVYQQQLAHVLNGCMSDDPERLPYVKMGTINYHSTGYHLDYYQSLHGKNKV